MLTYIFRSLLDTELTSRQETLFRFTIALMLEIPNATLDHMIEVMQPNGIAKYAPYLDNLSTDAKNYFSTLFVKDPQTASTKQEVVARLFAIKSIPTISRMFSAPETKLDLYEEMGRGRVILINAAKSLLQEDGTELFSRFFLASILLAAEKRQTQDKADRLPTFIYIDECQDVVRRDEKLPIILDQARAFKVGLTLAHQRPEQMTPPVLQALNGSVAIKMTAHPTPHHFNVTCRGVTDLPVDFHVPHVDFATMPQMSREQQDAVRDDMRRRYSYTPKVAEKPQPPTEEKPDDDEW